METLIQVPVRQPSDDPVLPLPSAQVLLAALLDVLRAWDNSATWSFRWPFEVVQPLEIHETLLLEGPDPRVLVLQVSAGFARLLVKEEMRDTPEGQRLVRAAFESFARLFGGYLADGGSMQAGCQPISSHNLHRLLGRRPVRVCFVAINGEPVEISLWLGGPRYPSRP